MRGRARFAIGVMVTLAMGVLLFGAGSLALRSSDGRGALEGLATHGVSTLSGSSGSAAVPAGVAGAKAAAGMDAAASANAPSAEVAASPSPSTMVVTEASMAVTVKDVGASVDAVRRIVASAGGTLASLSVSTGQDSGDATPLGAGYAEPASRQPSSADLTLRIPAAQLAATQAKLAALGTIATQSESQTDVTQQHVDLGARLKNLRAEESRVRGFLAKAGSVTELLAIERELGRIRGDIESMQAQVDLLERQAAMATITLRLSQPGALIRPQASGWGMGEAVTQGVQAAASVVRVLTAGAIALSPVALLAWVVWFVVRLVRRARGRHNGDRVAEAT